MAAACEEPRLTRLPELPLQELPLPELLTLLTTLAGAGAYFLY